MKNPVVHFEIGCKDQALTKEFYKNTFDWDIIKNGKLKTAIDDLSKEINFESKKTIWD